MNRTLRILMVQQNPGSRTARIARALQLRNHEVHLLTRWPIRMYHSAFVTITHWNTISDLERELKARLDFDIWHVGGYNETEWLGAVCLCIRPLSAPVRIVYDNRDQRSLVPWLVQGPHGPTLIDAVEFHELTIMRGADGIIDVSPECAQMRQEIHPDTSSTPSAVVRSAVLAEEIVPPHPSPRDAIVFSGAMTSPGSGQMRDYFSLFGQLAQHRPVILQSAIARDQEIVDALTVAGCEFSDRVPDTELLSTLSAYCWGLVGFPHPFLLGLGALPNKLFEYLGARVVPVVVNCLASSRYVHENGYGITIENINQVPELLTNDTWERCRQNIVDNTPTMDQEVPALEQLYFEVLNRPPRATSPTRLSGGRPIEDHCAPPEPFTEPLLR